ncbi:hypothetical protein MKC91_08270 [[Clostridium] innocuum]|jgi:hypothetical protein|nr:hypothetical protein [[Clostridium] innocuum]MCR0412772.1 hypothetical protein [[Clostridium] innocuum]MCR0533922.1 hypothetical protein [[Clostridium] innocuum]MCR0538391.1 hypothetical protein [[Clostridium] innocuum]MDU1118684.1 hypothetical protein [Erysipelotrichaceae bacterium]
MNYISNIKILFQIMQDLGKWKKTIEDLRKEGLKTLDIKYVQDKVKQYKKRMTIPPFTTDDHISYLTNSVVSLDYLSITSAFVSITHIILTIHSL